MAALTFEHLKKAIDNLQQTRPYHPFVIGTLVGKGKVNVFGVVVDIVSSHVDESGWVYHSCELEGTPIRLRVYISDYFEIK